uniref:LRAT domain-containing protein n=1 Tax=Gopherus agassizii TaxID=38772 RepID=A0A452I842_9SAUR
GDHPYPLPSPGDLIEFQRVGYQHWGIYVGKGYVVHFTFPGACPGLLASTLLHTLRAAKVQKERLRNVARVSSYAVNNQLDKKHPPLPLSHVVKRAEHLVGKNIDYNLVMSNCEHFATLIRYGIAESQQVRGPVTDQNLVVLGAVQTENKKSVHFPKNLQYKSQ